MGAYVWLTCTINRLFDLGNSAVAFVSVKYVWLHIVEFPFNCRREFIYSTHMSLIILMLLYFIHCNIIPWEQYLFLKPSMHNHLNNIIQGEYLRNITSSVSNILQRNAASKIFHILGVIKCTHASGTWKLLLILLGHECSFGRVCFINVPT